MHIKSSRKSQSPQIGSMFLTFLTDKVDPDVVAVPMSQSPQIGSMFLTGEKVLKGERKKVDIKSHPLKSGQCFLLEVE